MSPCLKTPVCPHCGSINVVVDAAVEWDSESQEWVINTIYTKACYCSDCERGDCDVEWNEEHTPPAPINAPPVSAPQTCNGSVQN
jgi:hypothetical protein